MPGALVGATPSIVRAALRTVPLNCLGADNGITQLSFQLYVCLQVLMSKPESSTHNLVLTVDYGYKSNATGQ